MPSIHHETTTRPAKAASTMQRAVPLKGAPQPQGDFRPHPARHEPGEPGRVQRPARPPETMVLLDERRTSWKAVTHVAEMIAAGENMPVVLVRLVPCVPPAFLEHGGAEALAEEVKLDVQLMQEREAWMADKERRAWRHLDRAVARLEAAGLDKSMITSVVMQADRGKSGAERILELADQCSCHRIVLARERLSRWGAFVSSQLPEELLRRAKGYTLSMVQ